jgi:general stress protein 26
MAELKQTDDEKRKHLRDLIAGFHTAMLVTRTPAGGMRARPLAIAESRGEDLYFATSIESVKVQEVEADPHVNVALQDARQFVSLSGTARVVTDRPLIERLWSEAWKVWFPKGKDDPSLCLLVVNVLDAEYWDGSGAKGLRYLFEAAKAYVSGTRPNDTDESQNAKVRV